MLLKIVKLLFLKVFVFCFWFWVTFFVVIFIVVKDLVGSEYACFFPHINTCGDGQFTPLRSVLVAFRGMAAE